MTGFKSKKAAALDEDGMYLVHHTAQQDATMQSLKDLKRSVCDEVGEAAFAQPAQELWCMKMNGCTTKCDDCPDEAAQPAQPAREPDVVMHCASHTWTINTPPPKGSGDVNLYYAPAPQRPWVDLTPQDYAEIFRTARNVDHAARLATAKLKEKNNG